VKKQSKTAGKSIEVVVSALISQAVERTEPRPPIFLSVALNFI